MKIPVWLQSSQDPEKIALRVKGFLLGIVPLIIMLSKIFQVNIAETQINEVINILGNTIIAVWGAVSLVITLYGALRAVFTKK